nr:protein-glutamate O-methyltransferase CheR [Sphingomonas quercus]
MLEARTGQQLQVGRRWRLETGLAPLLRSHGYASADALVSHIQAGHDHALADAVVDALLNNETSFYRDQASFALLKDKGLARLQRERGAGRRLAIWCAGCSTGQEAYTLAMMFADEPARWEGWTIDIVATDVSRGAIEAARAGRYSHFEIQRGLPMAKMVRWFDKEEDVWVAAPALRQAVRFQQRSLLDAAPHPGRFDAILCRNVLLYFSSSLRRQVFGRLASVIAPDGVLMLGAGETVIGNTEVFVSDFECRGLYRPILPEDAWRAA